MTLLLSGVGSPSSPETSGIPAGEEPNSRSASSDRPVRTTSWSRRPRRSAAALLRSSASPSRPPYSPPGDVDCHAHAAMATNKERRKPSKTTGHGLELMGPELSRPGVGACRPEVTSAKTTNPLAATTKNPVLAPHRRRTVAPRPGEPPAHNAIARRDRLNLMRVRSVCGGRAAV